MECFTAAALPARTGWQAMGRCQNCYNRGNTLAHGASPAQAGGIAGSNLAEIRNCYYDQEKAASAVGGSDEQTGALTDQQLQNSASFAGFDFTAVWAMRDYPILRDVRQMSNIIVGDVDTNGIVETADVLLLLHVLNGNTSFRPTLEAADLSGDGGYPLQTPFSFCSSWRECKRSFNKSCRNLGYWNQNLLKL